MLLRHNICEVAEVGQHQVKEKVYHDTNIKFCWHTMYKERSFFVDSLHTKREIDKTNLMCKGT